MNDPVVAVLVFVVIGIAVVGPLVILAIAGAARMRGKRSRLDPLADAYGRAAAASVYPPSARGTPGITVYDEEPSDPVAVTVEQPRLGAEWRRSRMAMHKTSLRRSRRRGRNARPT